MHMVNVERSDADDRECSDDVLLDDNGLALRLRLECGCSWERDGKRGNVTAGMTER